MNKQDLMREMSERTGLTQKECGFFIDCLSRVIITCLEKDDYVKIPYLGALYPINQTSRPGRNPRTGISCMIPERKSAKFKASQFLLEVLNVERKEEMK